MIGVEALNRADSSYHFDLRRVSSYTTSPRTSVKRILTPLRKSKLTESRPFELS